GIGSTRSTLRARARRLLVAPSGRRARPRGDRPRVGGRWRGGGGLAERSERAPRGGGAAPLPARVRRERGAQRGLARGTVALRPPDRALVVQDPRVARAEPRRARDHLRGRAELARAEQRPRKHVLGEDVLPVRELRARQLDGLRWLAPRRGVVQRERAWV